jgi:hypothetical protein
MRPTAARDRFNPRLAAVKPVPAPPDVGRMTDHPSLPMPFVSLFGGVLRRWTRDSRWTWCDGDATVEPRVFDLTEEEARRFGLCSSNALQVLVEPLEPRQPLSCAIAPE